MTPTEGRSLRTNKKTIVLAMKLTAFFIMALSLHLSARVSSQTITLKGNRLTLPQVFTAIKQQTGYLIMCDMSLLDSAKRVTITANRAPLTDFLVDALKDQSLEFSIRNKTVFITPKTIITSGPEYLAPVPVTGRITDASGNPLSGATVTVKGKTVVTVTDLRGEFTLLANEGDVLLVSYIGFKNREYKVSAMSGIIISLDRMDLTMDTTEIVVSTGYQTISRERSAGSFSKPDMRTITNRTNSMNVLQRLDGLIPGLTVNNAPNVTPVSATDPGKNDPLIIRGITSINASRSPLFVVDGTAIDDISFINPQDVADITVLKDATAASIWGARASNGVIVVTTKKGAFNGATRFTYDGFVNFKGMPDLDYMPVMNSRQFVQAAKEVFDPVTYPYATAAAYQGPYSTGLSPHDVILYNQAGLSAAEVNAKLDSLGAIDNTGQIRDIWYRPALLTNHTLSASGGSKTYSYYGSLAYTNDQSNRPGDKNNAYKVNLRQDFKLSKRIGLYLITDLNTNQTSNKRNIAVDNRFLPYQLFQDAAGNSLSMPYMQYLSEPTRLNYQEQSRIDLNYNPLNEGNYGYTKYNNVLARINSGISIKLFDGLTFDGVYSYLRSNARNVSYDDARAYKVRVEVAEFAVVNTPGQAPVYNLPATGGWYEVNNMMQRNWTVRNQLAYDKSWNGNMHQLTVLAAQEASERLSVSESSKVRGYNEDLQTYANINYAQLASGIFSPVMANSYGMSTLFNDAFRPSEQKTRFTSWLANMAYTFMRKYSVNASWRIDQSNLFGKDKSAQNRPVMSGGVKWMLSEERFMKSLSWLDRLAIRATYGITGNSLPVAAGSSYDILRAGSSTFYRNGTGMTISSPGNSTLSWESTATLNGGVDFVLMNRLSGSVDVYRKKTKDLLGDLLLNPFSGYPAITGNSGELQNTGVEFTISHQNIQTDRFSWRTTLLGAYNKNKVIRVLRQYPLNSAGQKLGAPFVEGYSGFAIFAYHYKGLDNQGRPQIQLADKTVTTAYNIAKPQDVFYAGTYQPVWNGGLSNDLSYRNFNLLVNITYSLGNVMRRDINNFFTGTISRNNASSGGFTSGNLNAEFLNRWKKPGDEAFTDIPPYISNQSTSGLTRNVSYYIQGDVNMVSASFIKMRDVTLSYNLPLNFIRKIGLSNLSARAQLSNVMLWKANKYGIDPEFQNNISGTRTLPVDQHTISLGIHAGF